MAGAPIDKGAGIKVFKKIGDRVEQGEPLYRIYAFDQSEFDLAAAARKTDTGYAIDGTPPSDDDQAVTDVAIHCLPSGADDANGLRRGLAFHARDRVAPTFRTESCA